MYFDWLIAEAKEALAKPDADTAHAHKEHDDEYRDNEHTRKSFPDAFKDKHEFAHHYKKAKVVHRDDMDTVNNANTSGIKKGDHEESFARFHHSRWEQGVLKKEKHARAYYDKMSKAALAGKLRPSIVGVHKDEKTGKTTHHLISGNTRAMIHKAHGLPVPTVHVPLKGRHVPQDD